MCLEPTLWTPRAGKLRYQHACPHGVRCPSSVMPNAMHLNSYPPTYGCGECRRAYWDRYYARVARGQRTRP